MSLAPVTQRPIAFAFDRCILCWDLRIRHDFNSHYARHDRRSVRMVENDLDVSNARECLCIGFYGPQETRTRALSATANELKQLCRQSGGIAVALEPNRPWW